MKRSKACRVYKVYFWALVICIYLFLIVWSIIIFRLNGEIHFSDVFDITLFLSVATAIVIYHTRYIIDIQLNNNTIVFSTLGKRKYIIENYFPITFSGRRRTRSLYLYIEGKEYLGYPLLYRTLRDQILELEKAGYFKYVEPERRL